VSVGNYIQAGQTIVATVSTVDPVRVKFTMSENEYLKFARKGLTPTEWGQDVKLMLSDGTEYALPGQVEQVDRGLAQQTGTLTLKATFGNPQNLLVPGMFARVVAIGETRKAALLIPQRAIQDLLGRTFVTVVGEGDKAESRPIKVGPKVGNLLVVEEGLSPQDRVVVEGFAKAQPGMPLKVTMINVNELQQPASK
jgi:membrane fusion protein (multidrug efflux system)